MAPPNDPRGADRLLVLPGSHSVEQSRLAVDEPVMAQWASRAGEETLLHQEPGREPPSTFNYGWDTVVCACMDFYS
jgi:hypothetical protein